MASHRAAMRAMKPGMNEREIAALLNYEQGKRGASVQPTRPLWARPQRNCAAYFDDSGDHR